MSCRRSSVGRSVAVVSLVLAMLVVGGCDAGAAGSRGPIVPGDATTPREVNLIAKDDSFVPDALDLAPGETILLHAINGGLAVHEAVLGDQTVQDAWEAAEAAAAGAPPGPTPLVTVPPGVAGIRVVLRSGERVDLRWTVPRDAATGAPWLVGCHIPGHWARGMRIPIRWQGVAPAS